MTSRRQSCKLHARCGLVAAMLALSLPVLAWVPPDSVTADDVLKAARDDRLAGRLAEAAEKLLWFHEHSLERDPAMSGVRLSFALSDWYEVALAYRPAMSDMLNARDQALARVSAGGTDARSALDDVLAIDERLEDWRTSRDAFATLSARDPAMADAELPSAMTALVATQDYELASRHLHVPQLLARTTRLNQALRETPKHSPEADASLQRSRERFIDLGLARAILVLVKTGREAEADQVLAQGRELLGPDARTFHMEAARQGVTPPVDRY